MLEKIFNKKVLFNEITITFIFLCFFKPLLLYYYDGINKAYNLMMIISGIYVIINYAFYCMEKPKKQISKIQLAIVFYIFSLLISTSFGTHDFATLIKTYVKWLAISMYTEMLIMNCCEKFLNSLSRILFSYIVLDFITMILFPQGIFNPDGFTPVFFLGNDNTTTIMVTLGILFIWFRAVFYKNRLDKMSIISLVLALIIYLKNWSVTALIGVFMVIIYLIFLYKRNKNGKLFNYRNYVIFGIILFLLIVVFRIQNNFQVFIEGFLHKSVTFTGRTQIWDNCFYYIKNNLILGLGVQEFEVRGKLISIFHAHCTYLNVLLEGGILGFILFFNIFMVVLKKIKKIKANELLNILSFGIFIYLFVGIVEVYQDSQMLYIFLVMLYYFEEINKQRNERNERKESSKEDSFEKKYEKSISNY